MFTRAKFVTNSSSSAFLCYGIYIANKEDFVRRVWNSNILDEEDIKGLIYEYGRQEYTNNRTRKVITKSLDLDDPDEFKDFISNLSSGNLRDLFGKYKTRFDYHHELETIYPVGFMFFSGEGDVREITLPSQEEIGKANATLQEFMYILYPHGEGPVPVWTLGETYG